MRLLNGWLPLGKVLLAVVSQHTRRNKNIHTNYGTSCLMRKAPYREIYKNFENINYKAP